MKGLRIALGNKARVGKDTFANYVQTVYGAEILSIAAGIYNIATMIQNQLHKPIQKDPALLQILGEQMRAHYGYGIWIDQLLTHIEEIERTNPMTNIIVTDMRFPYELEKLKQAGFVTVRITRENRTIDRNPNHISEIALDNTSFDYQLANDSTIAEFHTAIDSLIKTLKNK